MAFTVVGGRVVAIDAVSDRDRLRGLPLPDLPAGAEGGGRVSGAGAGADAAGRRSTRPSSTGWPPCAWRCPRCARSRRGSGPDGGSAPRCSPTSCASWAATRRVYAREAGADDATVVTFRSAGAELDALGAAGPPFFRPPWAPGAVGLHLDGATDWDELGELLTESYCLLAPRRLAAEVDRPD